MGLCGQRLLVWAVSVGTASESLNRNQSRRFVDRETTIATCLPGIQKKQTGWTIRDLSHRNIRESFFWSWAVFGARAPMFVITGHLSHWNCYGFYSQKVLDRW